MQCTAKFHVLRVFPCTPTRMINSCRYACRVAMEATQRYGRIVSINHRFNFLAVVFFKLDMHLNSNIGKRYVVLSN